MRLRKKLFVISVVFVALGGLRITREVDHGAMPPCEANQPIIKGECVDVFYQVWFYGRPMASEFRIPGAAPLKEGK